nr:terminase large subunit [Moraxella sp. CTOTU48268]
MTTQWTTALPDWEERIVKGESLVPCKPLYPKTGVNALLKFKQLVIQDMIDSPTFGEVSRQWVFDFVVSIFGAYDEESKRQKITEFFLLISKKNTKSTLAAGIMMTALLINRRPSASLIILAPTKEVADNSFIPIRDMIKANERYRVRFNVSEHTRTITDLSNNATLKVIAAESDTLAGVKASFILIDELWLFGKRVKAESVLREATGGLASRPEGFVIYLSTQSDEPPAGIFKQKLDYARDVRDGKAVNNKFLPIIYEYPKSMLDNNEHLDPKNWYVTNPNLGASVDTEYLINQYEQVKDTKESLQDFMAKHLNVEIGLSLRANRWAGAEFWLESGEDFTLDEMIEQCEVLTVGIDGGGLDDLLGYAVVGRCKDNYHKWLLWTHAWCFDSVLERHKQIEPLLRDFESDGDLTINKKSDAGKDAKQAAEITKKLLDSGKLHSIGFDNAKKDVLVDAFVEIGIPENIMFGVSQGIRLAGYIQTTERKLAGGQFIHANQALMAWCAGNARVTMKGNGMMIDKQQSGIAKIDPLMGTFNAVALMSQNPEPPKKLDEVSVFFV